MHTSFKNVVLKIILPVVGIILAIVAATCGYNVINNQAPESRSQQQMVVAPVATATPAPVVVTPAPAAEETEAVQAEVTPAPVATNAPVSTDAPVAVASNAGIPEVPSTSEAENVIVLSSSSELKLVNFVEKPYTWAIYENDLGSVQYKTVQVMDWTPGAQIARNDAGIICRLYGRNGGKGRSANDPVTDALASSYFDGDGAIKAEKVRNGWFNGRGQAVAYHQLNNLWIVKLEGEDNHRLVVRGGAPRRSSGSGSSSSSSGSNGSSSSSNNGTTNNGGSSSSTPVVTPEATPVVTPEATPVVTPEATPVAPTPNPTLRPRVEVEAVASTPVVEVQPNPVEAETSTPVVEAQPNPGLRGR